MINGTSQEHPSPPLSLAGGDTVVRTCENLDNINLSEVLAIPRGAVSRCHEGTFSREK